MTVEYNYSLKALSFCRFQYVEGVAGKVQPMSDQLKDKLDDLSQEMRDRMLPEKVLQAENHAAQLNGSSAVLDG